MLTTITDKSTIKEICDIVEKAGGDMTTVKDRIDRIELRFWKGWIDVEAFDEDKSIRYISIGANYLQQYLKD